MAVPSDFSRLKAHWAAERAAEREASERLADRVRAACLPILKARGVTAVYLLHNVYNGCENIFRAIAAFFENDLGPGSWHADLLRRMRLTVPGYRPAVIDEELYLLLENFRGFRHVFRNCYSFELD